MFSSQYRRITFSFLYFLLYYTTSCYYCISYILKTKHGQKNWLGQLHITADLDWFRLLQWILVEPDVHNCGCMHMAPLIHSKTAAKRSPESQGRNPLNGPITTGEGNINGACSYISRKLHVRLWQRLQRRFTEQLAVMMHVRHWFINAEIQIPCYTYRSSLVIESMPWSSQHTGLVLMLVEVWNSTGIKSAQCLPLYALCTPVLSHPTLHL